MKTPICEAHTFAQRHEYIRHCGTRWNEFLRCRACGCLCFAHKYVGKPGFLCEAHTAERPTAKEFILSCLDIRHLGNSFRLAKVLNRFLAFLLLTLVLPARTEPKETALPDAKGKKAIVLLFIAHDCPISNTYAPEIKRVYTHYAPQKVAFYLVYADPDVTPAIAKKHAKDYGYTCPIRLDPSQKLVHRAGATITPEAAVFTPDGKLRYRGRIDDLYIGFGKQRTEATQHDLRMALDAVVQGRPVPQKFTQAIGCFIPKAK